MKYQRIREGLIKIMPEPGEDIKQILMTIARVSYQTAVPRGLGHLQPYEAPVAEAMLEERIEYHGREPIALVMDYIHGRDCRTAISKRDDDKWYFNAYAFEQRGVTSEEFVRGIRGVNAEQFLDDVAKELEKQKQG